LVDWVVNGTWRVKTAIGEYLDVAPGGTGGALRLVTVPISQVRHAFRVQQVQDVRTREWKVEVQPVRLQPPPAKGAKPLQGTALPLKVPMHLRHHGCLDFELSVPPQASRLENFVVSPELRAGNEALEGLSQDALRLSLDVDLAALAFLGSTVNFPVFVGDEGRAFKFIAEQLKFDPHSDRLDEAALERLDRPGDIPEAAWKTVTKQLRLEIHYRYLCQQQFDALNRFVQNVFIASSGLVETVGGLIALDGSQTINMVISAMFSAVASGVGAVPFPGAGAVSGGLKVAFELAMKDRGPGQAELTVAFAKARDGLSDLFNGIITATENARESAFNDWGKLQIMGASLESDGSPNRWPADDSEMRKEAKRLLELWLWKQLLKLKWHHMTANTEPAFTTRYSDSEKQAFEAKHKNSWMKYWPATQKGMFSEETKGFATQQHWLGYGSAVINHHQPDDSMCERLFEALKIPRQEVFTDASWNLTPETFQAGR